MSFTFEDPQVQTGPKFKIKKKEKGWRTIEFESHSIYIIIGNYAYPVHLVVQSNQYDDFVKYLKIQGEKETFIGQITPGPESKDYKNISFKYKYKKHGFTNLRIKPNLQYDIKFSRDGIEAARNAHIQAWKDEVRRARESLPQDVDGPRFFFEPMLKPFVEKDLPKPNKNLIHELLGLLRPYAICKLAIWEN